MKRQNYLEVKYEILPELIGSKLHSALVSSQRVDIHAAMTSVLGNRSRSASSRRHVRVGF